MKFLVVGDAMVDQYWYGNVSRINPEKHSAPLLNVNHVKRFPGGAANVAENLREMKALVTLVSGNGDIVKNRLIDDDGIFARFDEDPGLDPIDVMKLTDQARGCDAVLVSDYAKGSITATVAGFIRDLNLPTFVDTKVNPDYWCDWATCMFPNLAEYTKHKRIYTTAKTCILKQGENGAVLLNNGLQTLTQLAPKVTAKCVAGAGDTLFASYVACYMSLISKYCKKSDAQVRALTVAMCFASAAVSEKYTTAPTWEMALKQYNGGLLDSAVLEVIRAALRER